MEVRSYFLPLTALTGLGHALDLIHSGVYTKQNECDLQNLALVFLLEINKKCGGPVLVQ